MRFRKKKWQKFQHLTLKFNRKRFYDPISHVLFNFKNFFSRKFKYNLQNKQRLSFFYGKLRKSYLKKLVKLTLKSSKSTSIHETILFIKELETRLDTAIYRTYFSYSFRNARQLISHQKVYVNNMFCCLKNPGRLTKPCAQSYLAPSWMGKVQDLSEVRRGAPDSAPAAGIRPSSIRRVFLRSEKAGKRK